MDWLDPQNSLSSKIFADKHPNLIPVYKSVFIESESLKIVLITAVWIVKIEGTLEETRVEQCDSAESGSRWWREQRLVMEAGGRRYAGILLAGIYIVILILPAQTCILSLHT